MTFKSFGNPDDDLYETSAAQDERSNSETFLMDSWAETVAGILEGLEASQNNSKPRFHTSAPITHDQYQQLIATLSKQLDHIEDKLDDPTAHLEDIGVEITKFGDTGEDHYLLEINRTSHGSKDRNEQRAAKDGSSALGIGREVMRVTDNIMIARELYPAGTLVPEGEFVIIKWRIDAQTEVDISGYSFEGSLVERAAGRTQPSEEPYDYNINTEELELV